VSRGAGPKLPKELRPAARRARRRGWTLAYTGTGHVRWVSPLGEQVVTASTTGGHGPGVRNAIAALKRAGLTGRES
jgi:hypothetical protein